MNPDQINRGSEYEDILLRNQELKIIITELTEERDEARRIACSNEALLNGYFVDNPRASDPKDLAKLRGWDCFTDKQSDQLTTEGK